MHPDYTPKDIKRFWSKVNRQGDDDCWEWKASLTGGGYGRFRFPGCHKLSHRLSWEFTNGAIPDCLDVLHECDNRKCVNPKHLFLGTHQDNMKDRDRKGRTARQKGEKRGQHKLTVEQVEEIRQRYASGGISQRQLAREYGIVQQHVSGIVNHRFWP
jgi:HNH endonuclease